MTPTIFARSSAGDPAAIEAVNDAVSFISLWVPECKVCCTGMTDGDICEGCKVHQERIAEVILWVRRSA